MVGGCPGGGRGVPLRRSGGGVTWRRAGGVGGGERSYTDLQPIPKGSLPLIGTVRDY